MVGSRCTKCGEVRWPPVVRCPACSSAALEEHGLDPAGVVVAVSRVHSDAHRPSPWTLLMVETVEGVHLIGFGPDGMAGGERVVLESVEDGVPRFSGAPRLSGVSLAQGLPA